MPSVKRLALGLAIAGLWATSAGPILAADNGTVDAQVTVATPCVTINTPTIDFGTLPFSSETLGGSGQKVINYANCGDAAERIWAAGTNATGTSATWQLSNAIGSTCSVPVNNYRLLITDGAIAAVLSTAAQELELLDAEANNFVTTTLDMPCLGSDGAGQVMSFQILITATF